MDEVNQTLKMHNDPTHEPGIGLEQLRKVPIFEYFSDKELSELIHLGELQNVKQNTNVVIEGEQTRGLYIIQYGKASVYKTDKQHGNMIRLAYLERDDIFGELSLFDDVPRSATVIAETSSRLYHLAEPQFNEFLNKSGDNLKMRFYKKCAEIMVYRFREQNDDYITSQKLLWKYALDRNKKE